MLSLFFLPINFLQLRLAKSFALGEFSHHAFLSLVRCAPAPCSVIKPSNYVHPGDRCQKKIGSKQKYFRNKKISDQKKKKALNRKEGKQRLWSPWSSGPPGPLVLWSSGLLVLWSAWSSDPQVLFWSSRPLVFWSFGPLLWSTHRLVRWSPPSWSSWSGFISPPNQHLVHCCRFCGPFVDPLSTYMKPQSA